VNKPVRIRVIILRVTKLLRKSVRRAENPVTITTDSDRRYNWIQIYKEESKVNLLKINTLAQAIGAAVGGVLVTHNMKKYLPDYETLVPDLETISMLISLSKFNPFSLIGMVEGFVGSMHFFFFQQ